MSGLTDGPAAFQRLIIKVMGPYRDTMASYHLDDVLIPANDWDEMLERLRRALEAFSEAKRSSCSDCKNTISERAPWTT